MSSTSSTAPETRAGTPTIGAIVAAVSAAFNVSERDIRSRRRQAHIIPARRAVFYLARELTNNSFPEIGRAIGDCDHSTVLYGAREATKLVGSDPDYAERVAAAAVAAVAMQRTSLAKAWTPADPVDAARMILRDRYEAAIRIRPDDLAAVADRVLQAEDVFANIVQLLRVIDQLVLDLPSSSQRRELAKLSKHLIAKVTLGLSKLGHIKLETIHVHDAAE
jgi:hypothetical protein